MAQYLLPFIAALIGWFTNWIAVKMLFRPRRKIVILGFNIQGVFPKRQAHLAEKIGKMVADELLSSTDIKEKILSQENLESIQQAITDKLDDYLNNTFPKNYPVFSMLLGSKGKLKVREDFLKEIHGMMPAMIEQYLNSFEKSFDVQETIRQRVAILSPAKLEDLINGILKKEFVFIEFVGAILGFLIGVIQLILVNL